MLYEELMMDSGILLKFKLFKRITQINQQDFPITQLAEIFSLNYQQTSLLLVEIEHDLKTILGSSMSILKKAGKIDSHAMKVTIDEYRYFLLQRSVPFQYIVYFLNNDSPNIDDFCEKNFVSRSTVSRKMIPLQKHVKQFNLRFTYTEANLTGDERSVRVALFDALWLGTRGTAWPFNVSREVAETLVSSFSEYYPLSKTYLGSQELAYFTAIFLCRTRKKFFVQYDSKYNFLMQNNPYYDFDRLNNALGPLRALSPEQSLAESSFIFFLAHYAPFYTVEDDPSLAQTISDFSTRPNQVYALVQEFLTYAKNTIFVHDSGTLDTPILLGNLLNVMFVFYVLRQPFPNLQRLVEVSSKRKKIDESLENKILFFFEKKMQETEYQYLYKIKKQIIYSFKAVLLQYFDELKFSERLKVGIAFEHNFLLVQRIYQFLNSLGFVDTEPYQELSSDEYDLVISSTLLPLKTYPDLPIYFWDLAYNDEELADLYKTLQQLFAEKNLLDE